MSDAFDFLSKIAYHALSAKQVSRRLSELLPYRLEERVREYRSRGHNLAKAQRLALIDPQYISYLKELAEIRYQASQYDMLWQNNQLRRFFCESMSHLGF